MKPFNYFREKKDSELVASNFFPMASSGKKSFDSKKLSSNAKSVDTNMIQKTNPTIFDDFKGYMKEKVNKNIKKVIISPQKTTLPEGSSPINNQVERILYKKFRLRGKNHIEKFENKMKVFKILDSYVDIKEYMKKINLLYNPNMKEILSERKKKTLRNQFYDFFGVNINELEEDSLPINLEITSKKTIESPKLKLEKINKNYIANNDKKSFFLENQLKNYLLTEENEKNMFYEENEKNSLNYIFENLEETKNNNNSNNALRMISPMNSLKRKLDLHKRTHYAQEMEKFQNLIENSINFNLIKKCKNDEEEVPSHFYYLAYKTHAQKIQNILKKTCSKLYKNKLDQISQNKQNLSNKIKDQLTKTQNHLNEKYLLKLHGKNQSLNNKSKSHLKNTITTITDIKNIENSISKNFISQTIDSLEEIDNFNQISSEKKANFFNNSLKRKQSNSCLPKIQFHNNCNSNIKSKFSSLMDKIYQSETENADKKILMMKEIEDIEKVFEKDLKTIKSKQFDQIDSIHDINVENKVEEKIKLLKSYFSNKKKSKYIIKL